MNYLHIFGIFLKNLFLIRRSLPRLFGLFYWVTIELLFWGFITFWMKDFAGANSKIDFVVMLLCALIFWDMFVRIQQSFTVSFLEDVWSRNLINLFASPLKPIEFVISLIFLSVFQGLVAFVYVVILASVLYALNIGVLGFYMLPFLINIFIFGWFLGLMTISLIIRFGPSAEILAWSIPFLLLPFSAVYYPLDVLPALVQKITFFLPTTHLFEGMRVVLTANTFPAENIFWATVFNIGYFAVGLVVFYRTLKIARNKGLIARLLTD